MNTRRIGAAYEKAAAQYIESLGYTVLETNFRCRTGEIDLIARDGRTLVFLEVKYRKNAFAGLPAEAVNGKKQRIISHVAAYYCHIHGYGEQTPCRFDVVSICGGQIQLIKDAFEYQY